MFMKHFFLWPFLTADNWLRFHMWQVFFFLISHTYRNCRKHRLDFLFFASAPLYLHLLCCECVTRWGHRHAAVSAVIVCGFSSTWSVVLFSLFKANRVSKVSLSQTQTHFLQDVALLACFSFSLDRLWHELLQKQEQKLTVVTQSHMWLSFKSQMIEVVSSIFIPFLILVEPSWLNKSCDKI